MKTRYVILGALSLGLSFGLVYKLQNSDNQEPQKLAQTQSSSVIQHSKPKQNNSTTEKAIESKPELYAANTIVLNSSPNLVQSSIGNRQTSHKVAFPHTERPQISLPERANGLKAFELLKKSGKLAEFASYYDMSIEEVKAMFQTDPSAYVDTTGALSYVEAAATTSGEITTEPDSGPSVPAYPLDQTFELSSKPNSPRTIYLNFLGPSLRGTIHNINYQANPLHTTPFDLDNNPGTFSTKELIMIQNIWRRVAEDYAPFDVNVTTKAPDQAALDRSSDSDNQFGITAVITKDFTAAHHHYCHCGGFAYTGSIDDTSRFYKPVFVFTNKLGNHEKSIAEAISHEVGHSVGLGHQGTTRSGYYRGQGKGATAWAPIMGVSYYKPLTQWAQGEYNKANNHSDAYGLMGRHGVFFDNDDYSDTLKDAVTMASTTYEGYANESWQGVLQGPDDLDIVSIRAGAGSAQIDAKPFIVGPDADLLLKLFDAQGNLLASANPPDSLDASISYNLPTSGLYYVSVEGTGKGDPMKDGYSKYGSIGVYNVKVKTQLPTAEAVAPKAIIDAPESGSRAETPVSFSAANSSDPNKDIVSYKWNFGDGTGAEGVKVDHVFAKEGQYTVTLTVTDATNLSDSTSIDLSILEAKKTPALHVENIYMSVSKKHNRRHKSQNYLANANVYVVDDNGSCVPKATVTLSWSGAMTTTRHAHSTCNRPGKKQRHNSKLGAKFKLRSDDASGGFTVKVDDIKLKGYQFQPTDRDQKTIYLNQ